MPTRPKGPCKAPGCPHLVEPGEQFCDDHRTMKHQPKYDPARRKRYGRTWEKLRGMILSAEPICRDPYNVHGGQVVEATDVDHIIPVVEGGNDSKDNLQPLCRNCHSRKTADELRRRQKW